ncbi:MAG TPA: carbohydrate kinase family protein [Candidatus Saccharimonadales bacterium]|nr:carbohydrate kinase family protein [Candidatus Saccharimonadales bacterium]
MSLDVLSIGDVVTDAFIKLFDDREHTYTNEHGKWLAMPFGQKVPFEYAKVIEGVGNAANAAVSFARLGLDSGLISNVGGDQYGRDIINALHHNKVDSRFVHINPGKLSNYHYVLWYREERTILIKHEEYDYRWPRFRQTDIPKWIYFSSISKNALDEYHDFVTEWLQDNPEVKFAFQPGTFQIEAGAERLKGLYARTDVLILNREEAAQVTGADIEDVSSLMASMHALGAKIVVVTDGPAGAYASDGMERFKMPPYPDPAPPFERTGAGDAFSSTFVAALIQGNTIEGALQWAPINSMNVVQHTGAQEGLLSGSELEELLKKAPSWYKPEPF